MEIKSYSKALGFLNQFIPKQPVEKFPGELWFSRAVEFMRLLGDPQEKLKIVHVAGTSGKGSTTYLTSLLLRSQGFLVGSIFSPHIIDIRERIQINNQLISKEKFVLYLNKLIPAVEKMGNTKFGPPSYFEILVALAFVAFEKEKVGYAVIETGLGGKFDATNVVKRMDKISLITKIGLDHTRILGNTLTKIATEKAGIIQKENIVISAKQANSVKKILIEKAKNKAAKILFASEDFTYRIHKVNENGSEFNFTFGSINLSDIELSLVGIHQVENCSLALFCLFLISKRDKFDINIKKLKTSLAKAYFIGRFDIQYKNGKTIIIDGAHNPQKMRAFISSLKKIYLQKKFDFLIAVLATKEYKKILRVIIPVASSITISSIPQASPDFQHVSADIEKMKQALIKRGFKNTAVIKNQKEAIDTVFKKAKNTIVITGSLYFLGEVYRYLNDRKTPPGF